VGHVNKVDVYKILCGVNVEYATAALQRLKKTDESDADTRAACSGDQAEKEFDAACAEVGGMYDKLIEELANSMSEFQATWDAAMQGVGGKMEEIIDERMKPEKEDAAAADAAAADAIPGGELLDYAPLAISDSDSD
jgi:hypothetical protein